MRRVVGQPFQANKRGRDVRLESLTYGGASGSGWICRQSFETVQSFAGCGDDNGYDEARGQSGGQPYRHDSRRFSMSNEARTMHTSKLKRSGWKLAAAAMWPAVLLVSGCQVEYAGQTLPSPYYLSDDVQYYAPGPEFKLAREAAAMKEQQQAIESQAQEAQRH
jgi:hypothetical protein